MHTTDSLGYWIRRQRMALDLTQMELAKQVGCAEITLRKIEADERRPSPQMAQRLAHFLHLAESERVRFMAIAVGSKTVASLPLPTAPRTTRASVGHLPAPVTPLIGRTAEIAASIAVLQHDDVRILTLSGPIGVGKTRLALAIGQELQGAYRHGVHFVPLETTRNPASIAESVIRVLGAPQSSSHMPPRTAIDFLATRHALLIFDGFEHLLPAVSYIAELARSCAQVDVIITTRNALHLYGEHQVVVTPLSLPEGNDPDRTAASHAVQLFCARAQAVQADFCLTPASVVQVATICRHLDGLPLAIESAAAQVKLFSLEEIAQRLEKRLPLPDRAATDLPTLRHNLTDAITLSYELLSPPARRLLAHLAIFEDGFCLQAAAAVCVDLPASGESACRLGDSSCASMPTWELADDLTSLLDRSLLARVGTNLTREKSGACCERCPVRHMHECLDADPRFAMFNVIRTFALARLRAAEDEATLRQRHADYFVHWLAAAAPQLHGANQGIWLARVERDAGNLCAALDWLLDTDQLDAATRLACDLAIFWQRRGRYREGRQWLERILGRANERPCVTALHARILRSAATLGYRHIDRTHIRRELAASLSLYRKLHDVLGMVDTYCDLGEIALEQAEWSKALALNQQCLALAQRAGDQAAICRASLSLGRAYLCVGRTDRAASLLSQTLGLAQELGALHIIAASHLNLGRIALREGKIADAVVHVRASLRFGFLLGEEKVLAEGLETLAAALVKAGRATEATRLNGVAQVLWAKSQLPTRPRVHAAIIAASLLAFRNVQPGDSAFETVSQQREAIDVAAVIASAIHDRTVN